MKNLSPDDKEFATKEKLLKFLVNNPKGLHITDIQKQTGISRKTLEKHLNILEYENEIYCKQFGPTKVYYPNNRIHHNDFEVLKLKNRNIWSNIIENEYGTFLLIRETRLIKDKWLPKGSVLIPLEKGKQFISNIQKLLKSDKIRK
jgi:predicted transcriptional regulator|tara:strand:- start:28 stop:465 length:438 start_codon:yes stop_codon:yes gene_type:complete